MVQEKKESKRHTGRLVTVTTHTYTCYWIHTLQAHGFSRHPDDQGETQQDEGLLKHLNKVHLLWLTCGFCTASIWENAVIFKACLVCVIYFVEDAEGCCLAMLKKLNTTLGLSLSKCTFFLVIGDWISEWPGICQECQGKSCKSFCFITQL